MWEWGAVSRHSVLCLSSVSWQITPSRPGSMCGFRALVRTRCPPQLGGRTRYVWDQPLLIISWGTLFIFSAPFCSHSSQACWEGAVVWNVWGGLTRPCHGHAQLCRAQLPPHSRTCSVGVSGWSASFQPLENLCFMQALTGYGWGLLGGRCWRLLEGSMPREAPCGQPDAGA